MRCRGYGSFDSIARDCFGYLLPDADNGLVELLAGCFGGLCLGFSSGFHFVHHRADGGLQIPDLLLNFE